MNGLREVKEIFDRIVSVSAKSSKEAILRQNKDNELFKQCLKFLLDPSVVTGLSTKKLNKKLKYEFIVSPNISILKMFKYLEDHNTGTDDDIKTIQMFCKHQTEDEEFWLQFFAKKVKLGMDVKTANKVYPGFIVTHDIMLASKYEGKLKEDVSMSLKLDGIRMSIVTINGETKALSRQGKEITGIDYIIEEYKDLGLSQYFIDGEIIRVNNENLPSDENFRLTTQIVNSKSENKEGLEFIVFDMTPMEDYINHISKLTYKERLNIMGYVIGSKGKHISLVKKYGITNNVDDISGMLDEVVSNGYEGLILNAINSTYEFGKRPKSIMKVKKFKTADMLVYDVFEGEGSLKGTLGGIKLKGLYNGDILYSDCGSGFNLDERKYLWSNLDDILNKICTIKYFEISENSKTKVKSLRFCTWLGMEYIRRDKVSLESTNID
ncbi:MAG: hypothetical protein E6356_13850 [Terrisporobacter othiniensis]|nr:hypothetical protein [Terrisporobacter othiniensis]